MLEKHFINRYLAKTNCYKCGNNLEKAQLTPISEVPIAFVAHAKCSNCSAESVVTITVSGTGIAPLVSELKANEIKKFIGAKSISYDDVLALHKQIQNKSICKLLHKLEKNLENNQKV